MDYQEPVIITILPSELENIIKVGACSAYVCMDYIFNCSYAQLSSACTFYDSHKCDPYAAPTASHGGYN